MGFGKVVGVKNRGKFYMEGDIVVIDTNACVEAIVGRIEEVKGEGGCCELVVDTSHNFYKQFTVVPVRHIVSIEIVDHDEAMRILNRDFAEREVYGDDRCED